MQFERYREIMKTHGITELIFLYDDTEYIIFTDIDWDDLSYFISLRVQDKMFPSFSNFDEFVTSNFFNGKSLTDIWNDIEIVLIDGMRESEYDPNEASFNFVEWKESMGNIQWEHSVVPMRSFLISLRYVLLGVIPIPALSILFPLLGLANWTIVIFFSSFALLPFLIYSIWFVKYKDYLGYHYKITTKKL